MTDIVLRPLAPEDLEALTGGDSEFDDWGPRGAHALAPAGLEDHGEYAVVADGELAGLVSWHYVQWGPGGSSRGPNIGIWLIRAHRGKGVGAIAQRQLAEMFFTHTSVNRVEACTDTENLGEQKALERAGFTQEGRQRGSQWRAGGYRDMYVYAIVRTDVS